MAHVRLEAPPRGRRPAWLLQARLHERCALEGTGHRQVDARRKHRVDEGVGIAQHQPAVAAGLRGAIAVVAGGLQRVVQQLGLAQAVGQHGGEGHGVHEEVAQRAAAGLQVLRPTDGADAGAAIGQRDEPEPALLEPEDADVAFFQPLQAPRAAKVGVDRSTVVAFVAGLQAQLARQQRVAAGSVDDEAGPPVPRAAVGVAALHGGAVRIELHLLRLAAFERLRTTSGGVAEEQFIELGTAHLPGIRHGLVDRVGEGDVAGVGVLGRHQLDAVLAHADGLDLLAHAQRIEERAVGGQEGFTDVKARVLGLLQQQHPLALPGQQSGGRAACGSTADDEDVDIRVG